MIGRNPANVIEEGQQKQPMRRSSQMEWLDLDHRDFKQKLQLNKWGI